MCKWKNKVIKQYVTQTQIKGANMHERAQFLIKFILSLNRIYLDLGSLVELHFQPATLNTNISLMLNPNTI